MKKIIVEVSDEFYEQLENLIHYTPFDTVEEYIIDSLNDMCKNSNFNEPNNLIHFEIIKVKG